MLIYFFTWLKRVITIIVFYNEINGFENNEIILEKLINRFILQGNNSEYEIDALLYGVPEDFI